MSAQDALLSDKEQKDADLDFIASAEKSSYGADDKSDPLLRQLPEALIPFIVYPKDHHHKLAYVERSPGYAALHSCLAILCCLPCGYSLCKMVVVQKGKIALTQFGDEQEILQPGRHCLLSPWNTLIGVKPETEQVIRHGPIHIIKVRRGELGYGIDMSHGTPVLLAQGEHVIKSTTFVWKQFLNLRAPVTQLDQMEIIRVEMGNVGYCYRGGNLVILQPGLHLIQPPDRFGGFLSTQMSILDLPEGVHDTSDYVPLAIKASVFYRIVDARKALLRIANIQKQIEETSVATLAGIIRSSSLSDVASRSQPFYHDPSKYIDKDGKDGIQIPDSFAAAAMQEAPSAPPFFQHVHDEFIQSLADHVLEEWGVEIQNIRIESLKINDDKLQQDISSQAVLVSQQHNRFIMLQKQQAITRVEAEQNAEKKLIGVNAEARAVRAKAQAEADAVIIRAKADKEATRLRGEGESEYSQLLERTALGKELSLMKIQSEAIRGIQSVAYVPHLPGILSQKGMFSVGQATLMPLEK